MDSDLVENMDAVEWLSRLKEVLTCKRRREDLLELTRMTEEFGGYDAELE